MERLVHRLAQALAANHELGVIGPEGAGALLPTEVRTREVPSRPLWRFLLSSAVAVLGSTRGRDADWVVAGSGLTAPLAWWAARRMRARFAVYAHGLDIVAPSRVYQWLWLPFIRRADIVFANSRNTRRLAIERGVPGDAIRLLHPGTDLPGYQPEGGVQFRQSHGLGDRPVLLSVGRFTPRKGLAEFILHAMPAILARRPDTLVVVIGADATDAVARTAGSQQARILECAEQAGVATAIRMLPPCDDRTLFAAYQAADVHVFPVVDVPGDVEGFGMVAIEAAAHGAPTVGFAVGGVPDAIIENATGSLVAANDYEAFVERVFYWLDLSRNVGARQRCAVAASEYAWSRFGERLQEILGRS